MAELDRTGNERMGKEHEVVTSVDTYGIRLATTEPEASGKTPISEVYDMQPTGGLISGKM